MKVVVYAAGTKEGSKAFWTMVPEVDYAYWLDRHYREAVGAAVGATAAELGLTIVTWSEPIPLGHALQIVERWPEGGRAKELDGNEGEGRGKEKAGVRSSSLEEGEGRRDNGERDGHGNNGGSEKEKAEAELVKKLGGVLQRLVSEAWAGDARMGLPVSRQQDAHAKHVPGAAVPGANAAGARALAARAGRVAALLQGRALLSSEALALLEAAGAAGPAGEAAASWSAWAPALQLAALLGRLRLGGAVAPQPQPRLLRWLQALLGARPRPRLRCQRCGSGMARMRRTPCAACGRACAYCEACLAMGRSRECGLLILGTPSPAAVSGASCAGGAGQPAAPGSYSLTRSAEQGSQPPALPSLAAWNLSPAQTAAASAALAYMAAPADRGNDSRRFLLWAVTGAGKTEMIFPLVAACLSGGGRALIATPRRDVVLELDPRIRKAFPDAAVVTLYGGSPQRWDQGDITLATTHQLFRFREGFELVIIDVIDAFPYHGDPMLQFAASHACKPQGVNMLLSATPPAELRSQARSGRLPHVRVPVRFHRHPLPVPVQLRIPPVRKLLAQCGLPRGLSAALRRSIARGAQLFVFVQQIREVEPLAARLRQLFPALPIGGTSSQDPDRTAKVQQFRDRTIRLLVTTTILERGVTVPRSDVFILDADGRLFDDASLIQMAGRAGRSSEDPAGSVYFCAAVRTRAQQSAIAQIRGMNRIARRQGYLLPKKGGESDCPSVSIGVRSARGCPLSLRFSRQAQEPASSAEAAAARGRRGSSQPCAARVIGAFRGLLIFAAQSAGDRSTVLTASDARKRTASSIVRPCDTMPRFANGWRCISTGVMRLWRRCSVRCCMRPIALWLLKRRFRAGVLFSRMRLFRCR
ncbi:DEAD/DEAH box helicase [Paenibacillus sp. R14(2021)]|uniref:DEAD/DEAH box helicase n=1 Tax=Paenibacillus sp. R14(2021) TaxID=2859228 RepID=UPI001C6137CD|nr:helicase-related protein [Paenibacillus sp. R14(2021)]